MTVDPEQGANRTTTTRWFAGGQMRDRTKPNGTRDVWSWNGIAEKSRHERIRSGQESDPDPQAYSYDANGNRTADERGEHQFNARDQLVFWQRPTDRGRSDRRGWTTSYTLDGSGAQVKRVDRDQDGIAKLDSDFVYNGEQLDKAITVDNTQPATVTTTQTYRYDNAGNIQRIYSQAQIAGEPVPQPEPDRTGLSPAECAQDDLTASTTTTRYCYDEFNRQVFAAGSGIEPYYVSFDGLDRRDRKVRKDATTGAETETHDYSYLGTTELLASEITTTTGTSATTRNSYDYDSRGDRQGQQTDDATTTSYRGYAKDANGSVTGLENTDGTIAADERYDYDPYGELDRQALTGIDPDDGLSSDAKANPFRFEGFYYDSGVKTYDMQARQYRPDVGRFLSRDTYASAAGDQALSADPLTQNRYAFAGANPTTNVEFDGHEPEGSFTSDYRYCGNNCRGGQQRVQAQRRAETRALRTSQNRVSGVYDAAGQASRLTSRAGQAVRRVAAYQAAQLPPSRRTSDAIEPTDDVFDAIDIATLGAGSFARRVAKGFLRRFAERRVGDNLVEGASTRLAPGGGLAVHEAEGGHVLSRHVDVSETELRQRVLRPRGPAFASRFADRSIAEEVISEALDANAREVAQFALVSKKKTFEFAYDAGRIVGFGVRAGARERVYASRVQVVLRKTNSQLGYRIHTAYPEP